MTYFTIGYKDMKTFINDKEVFRSLNSRGSKNCTATIRVADIVSLNEHTEDDMGLIVTNRGDLSIFYIVKTNVVSRIIEFLSSREHNDDEVDITTKNYHDKYIAFYDDKTEIRNSKLNLKDWSTYATTQD